MFYKHIHFVGIGGSGMNGLAQVLHNDGYVITGSDILSTPETMRMEKMGIRINYSHESALAEDADVVVFSSAIPFTNQELIRARERGRPVIPRAEMLAEIMRLKYGIAIAGTHGKTTTTSMTAMIFAQAGQDPTAVIGGRLKNYGANSRLGKGEYMIVEADESDGSFLKLTPTVAVVTNIDTDHLDFYKDIPGLLTTFTEFINRIPFYGVAVLCGDDKNVRLILKRMERKYVTYGISSEYADYTAEITSISKKGSSFKLYKNKKYLSEINIHLAGRHNVLNAVAASAVAIELDIPLDKIKEGLGIFEGVERRMEIIEEKGDFVIMDDYAHHPTEITATITAIRECGFENITVIFQPHRYSRTKILYKEIAEALTGADEIILTEIFPAGEKDTEGITARLIFDVLRNNHPDKNVKFCRDFQDIKNNLPEKMKMNSVLLTLGAGNIREIAFYAKEHYK